MVVGARKLWWEREDAVVTIDGFHSIFSLGNWRASPEPDR